MDSLYNTFTTLVSMIVFILKVAKGNVIVINIMKAKKLVSRSLRRVSIAKIQDVKI